MTAAQSACTPDRAALVTAMLSRLDRQSTRVPNTSNSNTRGGFTPPVSQPRRRAGALLPLLPDPGAHELVEHRQRDGAAAQDRAVEAADVEPPAELPGRP